MTPTALHHFLDGLVRQHLMLSTMIWGPPGVGKSSIVAQVAAAHQLRCIDIRLSQLAPTDLRGLPVAENGVARWYPSEFLPREGAGVLFLDEVNLAPPSMQGMAQQLILDRQVGNYVVPEGWYIWAAGNRKEDRAAVFDMPASLANRFLHLQVEPDLESFKIFALSAGIPEQVIAFLSYRPALLHRLDPQQPSWPSPRSWAMASRLHAAGFDIAPAVGEGAASEFQAFIQHYQNLPSLARILEGAGVGIPFPDEPSMRYATVVGLTARAESPEQSYNAFHWLVAVAPTEWVQLYATDLFGVLRARNQLGALARLIAGDATFQRFFTEYQRMFGSQLGGTPGATQS